MFFKSSSSCPAVRAYLSLGSNMGDRRANIAAAVEGLKNAEGVELAAVSSLYRAEPVGMAAGTEWFLNCVAAVDTQLEPLQLLELLEGIETKAGRKDKGVAASRPLDIDILLYGDRAVTDPGLTIPHPRMAERRFVLEPLGEIAPEAFQLPLNVSVAALARQQVAREGRLAE